MCNQEDEKKGHFWVTQIPPAASICPNSVYFLKVGNRVSIYVSSATSQLLLASGPEVTIQSPNNTIAIQQNGQSFVIDINQLLLDNTIETLNIQLPDINLGDDESDILYAINNSPSFYIPSRHIPLIVTTQNVLTGESTPFVRIRKYLLNRLGRGTYGLEGTQILEADIQLIYSKELDIPLIASNVEYLNGSFTTVQQALDSLLYVVPNISGFSISPNIVEIGTTVSSIILNWVLNKTFTSLSINNGIGAIAPSLLTRTQNVSLIANTTFTITGGDGVNVDSESAGLSFRSRRWWGTNTSDTLTSADILALASGELSTNRQQIRTINGGGKYIWFAFPTSYGLPNFVVNGLPSTAFITSIISHTNASGNTQNYYVIRTTTVQNGTLTIQIL